MPGEQHVMHDQIDELIHAAYQDYPNDHIAMGRKVVDQVDMLTSGTFFRINDVYSQRNELAIALVKTALAAGWKAGKGKDNDAEHTDWENVVYVDLPNGQQVSWHIGPADMHLLDDIPDYDGKWDGTFLGRQQGWSKAIK